jgi:serine/threonine protein phosphatase 1
MQTFSTEFHPLPHHRRPDRPLFAIGDIHGHRDALATLLEYLSRHIDAEYGAACIDLVYLGDYVDRGPDPLGVIDCVKTGIDHPHICEVAIKGNHDFYLAEAAGLTGASQSVVNRATWLRYGGLATLEALGVDAESDGLSNRLQDILQPDRCEFLRSLTMTYISGSIFCVHAGLDPDRLLDDQSDRGLMWIREPFLSAAGYPNRVWPFDLTVVHGHTPGSQGVFANRIGVDTGGYRTGVFTAVEICSQGARFHHVIRA